MLLLNFAFSFPDLPSFIFGAIRSASFSPEYDVIKKCDDIREEEQTRLVAIATLLKRSVFKVICTNSNIIGGRDVDLCRLLFTCVFFVLPQAQKLAQD